MCLTTSDGGGARSGARLRDPARGGGLRKGDSEKIKGREGVKAMGPEMKRPRERPSP